MSTPLKLLRAAGSGGKNVPTIKAHRWTREQQERIQAGCCVACGSARASDNSFLCDGCASTDTIADIRSELDALKKRLLARS